MKIKLLSVFAPIFMLNACVTIDNFSADESPAIAVEEPDAFTVNIDNIAAIIRAERLELPPFPILAPMMRRIDLTDEENEYLLNNRVAIYDNDWDEWFEANSNAMFKVIDSALSYVESSFAGVDFSIYSRPDPIPSGNFVFNIVYAKVTTDLISDDDIIYLLHALREFPRIYRIELNLDNGNQLFILSRDAIAYTIAYREQENETADQTVLDWWSIASGVVDIHTNTVSWQGFVEDEDGNFVIRPLARSPFE